jgi:hypothetical protein
MDRASASVVVEAVLQFASRINESIRDLMMTGPSGPQLNEYRRAAGRVLGYLYTNVLRPIVDRGSCASRSSTTKAAPFADVSRNHVLDIQFQSGE